MSNENDQGHDISDDIDDDDMEFEPATEDSDDEAEEFHEYLQQLADEDEELEEDDYDDEDEFHSFGQVEIEIEEEVGDHQETGATPTIQVSAARRAQIIQMLARSELGRLFIRSNQLAGDDDDDDDYLTYNQGPLRRRRRPPPDPDRFPKIPSEKGEELMNSGNFGSNDVQLGSHISREKNLARRILDRELGADNSARERANQRLMAQGMIPSSTADTIIHYNSPVYSGQFSDDGNFFFSCVKDFRVRMYDTSNPYKWKYYKTVDYPAGAQWTLTDASLSPDNKYLAYSSICPEVCLAPTDPNDLGDPYVLNFADRGRGNGGATHRHQSFGIWSIRFSGDGRELVAGTGSESIYIYDIESRRTISRIRGHEEDVNAVCFGDASSPHILYSGSDDTTLKVWDRRSMGDSREAGAFLGHTEGLTYIDSKGDGRYILSNGKDQSMKLWDLRMAMSTAKLHTIRPSQYTTGFDYRWGRYNEDDYMPHPHDNSLVTFRGHKVLRTLIRCHFSPPDSTNSRYVYSGSEDGKVYVYNMDATLAGKIDVFEATKDSRPRGQHYMGFHHFEDDDGGMWRTCVRDASWHPNAPVIAASSWNGYSMENGTVTAHSWNDGAEDDEAEPKMGIRVDDKLRNDPAFYMSSADLGTIRSRARVARRYAAEDDSD